MFKTLSLLLLCLSTLCSAKQSYGYKDKEFAELRKSFQFRGKPVHPRIVFRFTAWPTESEFPNTVTLDLATSAGSPEFPDDEVLVDGNKISHKANAETFSYEWLGATKSGSHLVLASLVDEPPPAEAGSGEVLPAAKRQKLIVIRVAKGKGYLESGRLYDRLLLTEECRIALADKDQVSAKIAGNSVTVNITSGTGKKRVAKLELP